MKRYVLTMLCVALVICNAHAQSSLFITEFLDTSSTRNMDVALLANGNAVVVGQHQKKAALYTVDTATGAILSAHNLGFTTTTFTSVSVGNNRIYLGGSCTDSISCGIIMALDTAFNVLWSRKFYYGGEVYKVYATPDNGCVCVAGSIPWIVRLSATGVVMWSKSYTNPNGSYITFTDLYISKEWNVIAVGNDFGMFGNRGTVVLAIDSSGNQLWDKLYSNPTLEMFALDITEGYNKDIIVTGTAGAGCSSVEITSNFILRLSDTGAVRWAIQYSMPSTGAVLCQPTQDVIEVDGNICVAQSRANNMSNSTSYSAWIMTVNPLGHPMSIRYFDQVTHFTGIYQAGNSLLISGYHQAPGLWTETTTSWLLKTDKQGYNGCMDMGGVVNICPFSCVWEQTCVPLPIAAPAPMNLTLSVDTVLYSLCLSNSLSETSVGVGTVYPNPASGDVTVELPTPYYGLAYVSFTDVLGKEFTRTATANNGKIQLNVADLACGMYFITVTVGEERYVQRIIRQ